MFGPGVYVTDSDHTLAPGQWVAHGPMKVGTVVIGNGCWLGARSVILEDVILSDCCVVAVGAVVTKCFPSGSIIAGVPARLIKTTSREQKAMEDTARISLKRKNCSAGSHELGSM
jgi:acetyltransferase-like isoleucine patch superfamily enzyme